ncbi:hypothetical protein K503DRAFT_225854 [Rhizopogon vinicolor AM-OR11-026]|uniref:Uncharacterized protein n=1 Tax=Rhizopogon vinicolor AM-OR11-026 TaxID=1314800 RepID=A0A1B7MD44_9AGAM|nr:hypothetical protein K503DRAFT_225854 [Rhizopogon vinicolor AM-OR11-026]
MKHLCGWLCRGYWGVIDLWFFWLSLIGWRLVSWFSFVCNRCRYVCGFKNTIGDFLTADGNNDTTLMHSQLVVTFRLLLISTWLITSQEDYWRDIVEFSGTQLRSGYSAVAGQYSSNEIPSNMTV